MTDHLPATAPSGDLVPVETAPVGDAIDPNAALPEYWTPPETLTADQANNPAQWTDAAAASGDEPTAPVRRRWRFLPRTLQWRLVSGVVVLVLIVVASAGFATYAALGSFLTDRLDQQVDASVPAYQRSLGQCIALNGCEFSSVTGGTGGFSAQRNVEPSWFAIIDPSGSQVPVSSKSAETIPAILTSGQRSSLAGGAGGHRSMTIAGRSVRVTVREVQTTAGSYYEIVGLSTDEVTNTLNRLLVIELTIAAAAVIVAFLATAFGVRFSLRPLHRVTNTARTVAAELSPDGAGLERRVEVTEPTTEVGQLAESVNTLLGAVGTQFAARVESEQRMRQFMADASHELRAPLTSIRGYAELARMQHAYDDSTEGLSQSHPADAEALARIESEGTRMSRLVEDLLTLARGDIGAPIESLPVDVSEIIDEAVEGAQAAHPNRRFGVSTYPGIIVDGDHDQLLRVIRNLLTNAAVHTAPGRPIRVSAGREAGQVIIQVIDSGPGLPPEQAAHVFERFWRSDTSRARTSGGSGLGLAIVASIVAAHGGAVRFNSSVEAGSVVTVTLPAR